MTLTDDFLRKRFRSGEFGRYRDELAGFFADVSKTRISFFIQKDTLHRGRRRTIKKRLGILDAKRASDDITTSEARKRAKIEGAKIEEGVAKPTAGGVTLRAAWEDYRDRWLKRKNKSPRTIAWYEDQIERALAEWLDEPLATIARDEIKIMHERIAKERIGEVMLNGKPYKRMLGGTYAANQAMRAFRAVYRHASDDDDTLPALKRFNFLFPEERRKTAIADLAKWWRDLEDDENEVRRCYGAIMLLSGCREEAQLNTRWEDLDIPGRKWRVPKPKGGEGKAFDIPLSYRMLRWLARARRAALKEMRGEATPWVFPSARSASGHISDPKKIAGHPSNDLRRTYRTVAENCGATQLQIKVLINHSLTDVTDGYAVPELMLPELVNVQRRISAALTQHVESTV